MRRIAIIGAGPKAAALCAKAYCLNQPRRRLDLWVFEAGEAGAAWTGRHGYTDGDQRLCTRPERDVGFPYERGLLDSAGVAQLHARFSWNTFLASAGGTDHTLKDWVDRGRAPPPHRLFADYVAWVIHRSDGKLRAPMRVTGLEIENNGWSVTMAHANTGRVRSSTRFDAVVVTGPGAAKAGFARPAHSRITDGVRFWRAPAAFLACAGDLEEPVVVAGSGGTAAAIAAWIARHNRIGRPILIIGNQAALFTRTESFFENTLFSDEDAWAALAPEDRVGVSQRLNRGVVWASVSDALSASHAVRFRPGRVDRAFVAAGVGGAPDELTVDVSDARGSRAVQASLVIDAAGFDSWWFADLLPARVRSSTVAANTAQTGRHRDQMAAGLRDDLSLNWAAPPLHAPMLSLAQGPGLASLMSLGAMSERILKPYV